METYHCFSNGRWCPAKDTISLKNPYDGQVFANVDRGSVENLEKAIMQSVKTSKITRNMSSYQRYEILQKTSQIIKTRKEDLAQTLATEAGKPIKAARVEVDRAVQTFRLASEEAKRMYGEVIPTDLIPANKGRWVITRRFPLGPVAGISPFNFPLNLVAHKVAPAIAAGNTITLKPASQTPLSALSLANIVHEAGALPGTFNVIPCAPSVAENLATDPGIKMITFTGSPEVGWKIKEKAGRKKITLELGGNAAVVLHDDADLDYAVDRVVLGSFAYAGQICISIQRILVHEKIADDFMNIFLKKVDNLNTGDPLDEKTDVGPVISSREADRVESWIREAIDLGGNVLAGNERDGNLIKPTVMNNIPHHAKIWCEEVFGPVVCVEQYDDFTRALNTVNDSVYGLQAGIFTNDIHRIWQAFQNLDVGGVILNDIPTFRADEMPYGGVKNSGFGREGLRYAIEEMTEIKTLALNMYKPI